jgi:D-alanyl-lipoteichoic acid acyltransferase DltB (MBOAT superfamily)
VTGRPGGRRFEQAQAAVVSVFLIAAVSGGLLLPTGARPSEGLHFLYAIVALAVIPLARSFLGRTSARSAAALLLVAFVVLGAVTYRLFTTG